MNKYGEVVGVKDGMAYVAVERVEACGGNCEACAGCAGRENVSIIEVYNEIGAKEGNIVELEASEKEMVKYSLLLYTVPLVCFLVGLFLGIYVFTRINMHPIELLSFGLGVLFLAVCVLAIKVFDENAFQTSANVITLRRIIK